MIKVGFFGTPELARCCFMSLADKYEIVFAVTGKDKAKGRSLKVCCTPVKECADEKCIDVLQPDSLKDPEFENTLREYGADVFVVVAYGRLIPRNIFSMPRLGTINMHPSLLPKYRGAAPIPWALINGESESGISIQMIDEKLDSGDIIEQVRFDIDSEINSGELYDKILPQACSLVCGAIESLNLGKAVLHRQNHGDSSYCGKIDRNTAKIDFSKKSIQIHNLIRGLNPKPGAWCGFRKGTVKIWKTSISADPEFPALESGTLFKTGKKRLFVKTSDGALEILEIQPENKKIMTAVEFINGMRIEAGECLF